LDISIVVPIFNEEKSLGELCSGISEVVKQNNFTYEIILLDDGSSDSSWDRIKHISQTDVSVKGIKLRRNYGKAAALQAGFDSAQGEVVITMDADLQDSPDEIPYLYRMIKEQDYDLVSGWKKKRYDPMIKTISSKLFNLATRMMSNIPLHDFNCGLKAYRDNVVKNIELYGEMHRYIPVIAKWAGYSNIGEKVVKHQKRKYGSTKFGLSRFIYGFLDLLSIMFVTKFGRRPMHFFGSLGVILFLTGFLIAFWLGAEKLFYLSKSIKAPLVTDKPFFYIALVDMILGTQLFLAGFLGELMIRFVHKRDQCSIEKKINFHD
jgi:glycosyltransferase involved in cell wall biosynthesis